MEAVMQTRRNSKVDPAMAAAAQEQEQEQEQSEAELRRGPWTVDEDLTLINYIAENGEGRWNALARAAGLKRTGKSCRLRWLNYLRPDVKRGNFTAEEQLLILDLHSRWGNRWSKIAQHLPGRTDNEIKNYWRTRVQKHAKQLNCDVNSGRFKDAMRYLWMPRLVERIQAATTTNAGDASCASTTSGSANVGTTAAACTTTGGDVCLDNSPGASSVVTRSTSSSSFSSELTLQGGDVVDGEIKMSGTGDWPMMHDDVDHDLWAAAMHMQIQPEHDQFQDDQDLNGWVQGFSEGVSENQLWSLEDIWKMQ